MKSINDQSTDTHLHGLLYYRFWGLIESGSDDLESYAVMRFEMQESDVQFHLFPHPFTFKLRYSLSKDGLRQTAEITSHGAEAMPLMLGFHTTLNVPFVSYGKGHSEEDCTIQVMLGQRWEMSERKMPTGHNLPLSANEQKMRDEGVYPFFEPMNHHYSVQHKNERNCAVLVDWKERVQLVYEAGPGYQDWLIWNNFARGGYVCPEPQTCVVNAPNLPLSPKDTGLVFLNKGETWSETCHLYIRSLS